MFRQPISDTAQRRLQVLQESQDGFVVAEADLAIRGPGELLGTRQTGMAEFRIASLPEHESLLIEAQAIVVHLYQHHPKIARTDATLGRHKGRLCQSLIPGVASLPHIARLSSRSRRTA